MASCLCFADGEKRWGEQTAEEAAGKPNDNPGRRYAALRHNMALHMHSTEIAVHFTREEVEATEP